MDLLARLLLLLVQAVKRGGTALIVMWLMFFLPASVRADAGGQSGLAASEEPKYLIFWSPAEQAGELAEKIGMKGDGKTRLLGFGLPTSTYELERQLPNRIRNGFAAAREHDVAVMIHFDLHLAWKNRPDLWNWFDPNKPGYDPKNRYNVEWHGAGRDPFAVGKLMEGVQPLAAAGKLDELEEILDQALQMLGETEDTPDVYGQD